MKAVWKKLWMLVLIVVLLGLWLLWIAASQGRAAITFDGTSNSCSTTANGNPGMVGQFPMTAGAWVTFTGAPSGDVSLVGHSSGGSGGWAIFVSDAGNCGDRKSTRLNSSHMSISYAV